MGDVRWLDAGRARAAAPLDHAKANERTLERGRSASKVHVAGVLLSEALEAFLGASAGSFGAGDVDLFSRFGGISEDGHVVVGDFHEAAGERK